MITLEQKITVHKLPVNDNQTTAMISMHKNPLIHDSTKFHLKIKKKLRSAVFPPKISESRLWRTGDFRETKQRVHVLIKFLFDLGFPLFPV